MTEVHTTRLEGAASDWKCWQPGVLPAWAVTFLALGLSTVGLAVLDSQLDAYGNSLGLPWFGGSLILGLGLCGTVLVVARTRLSVRFLLVCVTIVLGALAAMGLILLSGQDSLQSFDPSAPPLLGASIAACAALGLSLVCFLPSVRRILARVLPMQPDDFVHAISIAWTVQVIGWVVLSFVPFNRPLLYAMYEANVESLASSETATLVSLSSTLVWSIPTALLAIGFPLTRNLGGALARLGLGPVRWRGMSIGVGVGIGLAVFITVAEQWIVSLVAQTGLPMTEAELFEELASLPTSLVGAILLGLSAGTSEELLVRGVLQPRLGIVLANLVFAMAHGMQYGADGLIVVFLLGLLFGVIRMRLGLAPAIMAHAVYDIVLVVAHQWAT
ncbi:MAG: CPBP family intramembrane metalloprotease [Caldilineaceae bacterium SB0662_bin_9]|uniref:CPBP family intramembrane metalloprotease n=1 Tax=Caldilineaceae bacterium SB0662_bin_9 TaxID=2605258 RepID=A0A6B1DQL2_9CHLR|nr:CPBP family intramembrane metalloprotease [Caldilineaceae bacterium SB0662_bin_9]